MTHLLEIYVARHCFGTPEALELAVQIKSRMPDVQVQIKALDDMTPAGTSIFATPSYLLNGRLIFLGNPGVDELVSKIKSAPAAGERGAHE